MSRKLLVVRHGERCDYYFKKRVNLKLYNLNFYNLQFAGVNWVEKAFDSLGRYNRFDSQLPETVPVRAGGFKEYKEDTPITTNGYSLAVKTGTPFLYVHLGENLAKSGVTVDAVYSSPALRCIQTSQGLLEGLKSNSLIRVEPGLFQWTHWCRHGVMPLWLTNEELKSVRYAVDTSYEIIDPIIKLNMEETLLDYYERSYQLVQKILQKHDKGTILIVAHAGSLETLTRQLCCKSPLSKEGFSKFLRGTSYLSCCEVDEKSDRSWKLIGSPVPLLVYTGLDNCDV
uniref:Protein UBASH3A-like protein n=1 Tax=Syphacia muris TaxID=451379 RepID=A0A0N5ADL8_9BILA